MADLEKVRYPSMTHTQKTNTVVALAIEVRLDWQVGAGVASWG